MSYDGIGQIEKVSVVPIKHHLFCDSYECLGKRHPMVCKSSLLMNPPIYEHECESCGLRSRRARSYPFVEFVEVKA